MKASTPAYLHPFHRHSPHVAFLQLDRRDIGHLLGLDVCIRGKSCRQDPENPSPHDIWPYDQTDRRRSMPPENVVLHWHPLTPTPHSRYLPRALFSFLYFYLVLFSCVHSFRSCEIRAIAFIQIKGIISFPPTSPSCRRRYTCLLT